MPSKPNWTVELSPGAEGPSISRPSAWARFDRPIIWPSAKSMSKVSMSVSIARMTSTGTSPRSMVPCTSSSIRDRSNPASTSAWVRSVMLTSPSPYITGSVVPSRVRNWAAVISSVVFAPTKIWSTSVRSTVTGSRTTVPRPAVIIRLMVSMPLVSRILE